MGAKESKNDDNIFDKMNKKINGVNKNDTKINKNSFEYISIIGRGGYGRVWKVYNKKNKKLFALKEMSKAIIIDKNSVDSVIFEKNILSEMDHP